MTEDEVRNNAGEILQLNEKSEKALQGVGQITSFNKLGFKGCNKKPDGWYLPFNNNEIALILETKSSDEEIDEIVLDQLKGYIAIAAKKYSKIIGIAYNGKELVALHNDKELKCSPILQKKDYYFSLLNNTKIDKNKIYKLTQRINNSLHFDFGVKNLYHRMIFTACALAALRYGAQIIPGMNFQTLHSAILSTLSKSLNKARKHNYKLDILCEVYAEIKMNSTSNQEAIDDFIENIKEISNSVNSNNWNGEDVMGIFFNEFNRYKKKSENGQVFTPDHITSLMYRLLEVNKDDVVLDATCGSGAFLVKSMSNMIQEAGGIDTEKAKEIKSNQLFGIEWDREIYALACANMLIHKDGKTNIEHLDARSQEACKWIENIGRNQNPQTPVSKVLMNPPYERKYGCKKIVTNVLDNVPKGTKCGFILPDKKLEKEKLGKLLKYHTLTKIIKLPEKTFSEGVTTSIFIFEAGKPQNDREIFTCYIEEDGLITVKNQGRQDIKNKWPEIEDFWVTVCQKQSGHETCKWVKPNIKENEKLSYQVPPKPFELYEEDFIKTLIDYKIYEKGLNINEIKEKLAETRLYSKSDNE